MWAGNQRVGCNSWRIVCHRKFLQVATFSKDDSINVVGGIPSAKKMQIGRGCSPSPDCGIE